MINKYVCRQLTGNVPYYIIVGEKHEPLPKINVIGRTSLNYKHHYKELYIGIRGQ